MNQPIGNVVLEKASSIATSITGPTSVVNTTAEDKEFARQILERSVPTYRQAYSDRTAWVMSCLAELAYVRFNPLFPNTAIQTQFDEKVKDLLESKRLGTLAKLIEMISYDAEDERAILENDLGVINLKLVHTFDIKGTQAIIASTDDFIVLSFRGTESTSPKDIKSDCKANKIACVSGGMVHSGFSEAFDLVREPIQTLLDKAPLKDKPLFITGHSLGGALATIAAKRLRHNSGVAACYTFGSPRVGDTVWVSGIRTPVYRVVNAVDAVTMLPPGGEVIAVTSKLFSVIPFCTSLSKYLQTKFGGYLHSGDMRYLTNCKNGDFDKVTLLHGVSWLYRTMGLLKKSLGASRALKDHSISIYRKKLAIVARNRNVNQ